jgi:4-amino-4-deoxy-L-arabinose transferase-like glycosyltransferase
MLLSGDWVVPRFLGDLRAHKPPLIYWCQAAAMELFGSTAGAARFPSAAAVFAAAVLLSLFVWRVSGLRRAIWTALVFCTSLLTIAAAKLCITDGVLLLWICIGQGCLYAMWRSGRASLGVSLIFWVSTALAGLTKGPVVLAMHAGTMAVLLAFEVGNRWRTPAAWKENLSWWRGLHPLVGVVILIGLISPWLLLVNHRAPEFLPMLLNRAGKYATGGAEGHAHWPGFYLLMIWGTFFPWSLMLPTAIGIGLRHRSDPRLRFALGAAIGPWIVMELVTNKLPFYIFPSFPALAILTAEAIVRGSDAVRGSEDDDLKRTSFMVAVGVWGVALLAIGCVPMLAPRQLNWPPHAIAALWLGMSLIYLSVVAVLFVRRRVAEASAAMGIGIAAMAALFFTVLAPSLSLLNGSRSIGEQLNALGAGADTPVAMIEYREPSLAFYQGGGARESYASSLSSETPPRWAVTTMNCWSRLPAEARSRYRIVGEPTGAVIYNDGWRVEELVVLERR